MKKCGFFICFIFIITFFMLSSCAPFTVTLPENARVKGAAWVADDILAYYAEDGVHIWNAESGEGPVLAVSNTFSYYKRVDFALSPDQNKICVLITNYKDDSLYEVINCLRLVYDIKSGELLRRSELSGDYIESLEFYRYEYGIGFFDNDNLYIYDRFGIWIENITSGEQRRITPDSKGFYESLEGDSQFYFVWVYLPVMVDGKFYYSGIRDKQWQSQIYCADLNGETSLNISGDVTIYDSVPGRGFIYSSDQKSGDWQLWYYDIKNAASDLVSERIVLHRAIYDGKIAYYADTEGKRNCSINLYDINTKLTQTFELYKTTRDFPEADYCQLEWLYEVVPDGDGYAFIFKVGYYDNLKSTAIDRYLVYSTETDKAVVLFENDSNKFKEVTISPSGNYILIAPFNQYGYPHGYPLEVVKTAEYIHPNQG